jgi:predicted nuclease of restriction endonuclease-like (RecB) superfamily
LPDPQSDLARQSPKDPYVFDVLTLARPFTERVLETELIRHIEKFLLKLGRVSRQNSPATGPEVRQ